MTVDLDLTWARLGLRARPVVVASGEAALCLAGEMGDQWLDARTGERLSCAPTNPRPEALAWCAGLAGHPAPDSVDIGRWEPQIEGTAIRAQGSGDGALVDVVRGAHEVRGLWWIHQGRVWRARDRLGLATRVEVVAPGVAALLDPGKGEIELLFAAEEREDLGLPLPNWLAQEMDWSGVAYRELWALPAAGLLAISLRNAVGWLPLAALASLAADDEVQWSTRVVWPDGDPDRRVRGKVAIAHPLRTAIDLAGGRRLVLRGRTPALAKGESVQLVGHLHGSGSGATYRWLQRGRDEPFEIHPVGTPGPSNTVVRAIRSPVRRAPTRCEQRLRAGLQSLRAAGLLAELSDRDLDEIVDGLAAHLDEEELPDCEDFVAALDTYFSDPARGADRARSEGYLRHDWRFGQETDGVVAELAALAGGEPLLRQLEIGEDFVRLADPAGREDTLAVESLDDVVAAYNRALEQAGDPRRFCALETAGDWHAYLLLEPARRAKIGRLLGAEPI
jgi:hypothetical protein